MDAAFRELQERLAEIADLGRAAGVLGWDQRTMMPSRGGEARAEALATVSRIAHERFVSPDVGRLLERLRPFEESLDYDSDEASLIRVARRDWEKDRRVPAELQAELTRAGSRGQTAWIVARAAGDFGSFLPYLKANLELKRRYIECFEPAEAPYDVLLDDFEPGMKTAEVREVFAVLRPALTEIVASAPAIDASFLQGDFPVERQEAFAREIVGRLGFEDDSWRLGPTPPPSRSPRRTGAWRLPSRSRGDDLESLWSTLHESGHGLYAHGIAASLQRSPLGHAPSLGLNESQSRTWENLVGRSLPFWRCFYPRLRELFPGQLGAVELDAFWRAINRAEPGLIRVDADETTYSLHIILRFELEQELVAGTLAPEDLPEAWNERMREFLGVEVPGDADGVLQDVHWSAGGIGYFPTYALGNVISLQIWEHVRRELPDLDAQLEAGELRGLGEWLRERIYRHGRKFTPKETLERAIGTQELDPQPYLAYLRAKTESLRG